MNAVVTIVKLRWALTVATLHRSGWQAVGFSFSILLGLGTVIGVGISAWFVGIPVFVSALPARLVRGDAWLSVIMQPTVAVISTMLSLGAVLAQMIVIGEGSTMNPRSFALYGIKDRTLQAGLFLATMCGLPAMVGMLALAMWSLAYRRAGMSVMLVQIVAGALAIVTIVSIARMLVSLVGTLLRSRRSSNALYVVVMLVIILAGQLPSILSGSLSSGTLQLDAVASTGRWLAWTPFAAALQLPFDVIGGQWLFLFARVCIIAMTVAASVAVCIWCMRRDRRATAPGSGVNAIKGIGAFAWVPDTRSGAISARVLTNLRHDPRQAMVFILPLFFVVIFAIQSMRLPNMLWQALIWGGFFMAVGESNGLAYDGRGFAMQAQIGVHGRDDRRGRVRIFAAIAVVYLVILAVLIAIFTGSWRDASGWSTFVTFLGVALGVAFVSLGMAEIFSSVLLYPVPSIDHPFSSPQGRAMAQGFIPLLYMLVTCAALLPTIVSLIVLYVVHYPMWVLGLAGLANGVLVLAIGVWAGGRLMDRRLLSIAATLDSFASLQR